MIGISGSLIWSKTLMELISPVVNFSEVQRTQLVKSTLLISMLVPWNLFRCFKICPDAKERVGCRKQWEATAPIQSLVKLQAFFPEFAMEDLPLAELQHRFLHLH